MSSQEVVEVEVRDKFGSRNARRLRASGRTPAVLYGHGEKTVGLSLSADQVQSLIRHGAHVVQLKGAETGNALVREVQWDAFGNEVLHLDLTRVSAGETVEVTLPVELRGIAPGTREGGVVQHLLHEIELRCAATALPEKVEVNVNNLGLGSQITVAELELPAGVEAMVEADAIVVQCVESGPEREEEGALDGAEPEVIGRKAEDGDDE